MTILYSIIPALCLCIGFYFGFKFGKTNELPNIKQETKESKIKKESLKEIEKMNRVLGNIDRYNGSSEGQEEIV